MGVRFPFRFFLRLSLDIWVVWVKFHWYRIYGLRFDPLNPKSLVFESLWVEKAIFLHIWITESLILIPFLPTTFFRYVGGVSQVSWLSDLRFAFWPVNPKNLVFKSQWVVKFVFMHIWITGSPIRIPFILKTFFRCLGGVSYVFWLSDLRFAFWPPKP